MTDKKAEDPVLTSKQVERYHREGYVTPDFRLPGDVLQNIRLAHDRLVTQQPDFSDYCPALLAIDTWYLTVARRPEILDMVAQVIGEDIALWNSSFFAKPARVGTRTPWHQDGEYWPIEPLATCTVWIAIDAATPENGCLQVIPGSHRDRTLARHNENDADGLALNLELDASQFDAAEAVDIVLEPGQVSLHDVFLYHGSEPNHSDQSRRGMTLRFMPTTSVYRHDVSLRTSREGTLSMSERTVYLMRGIDRSGQNDFRMRH
jgi:ectoine hydroxylase-related dioxygenase (phytanoyl-CoA dioxygenase family)